MDAQILAPLVPIAGIIAFAAVKIVRIRTTRPESLPTDVSRRLEDLEHGVRAIQDELAEAQERLDFTERLLTKAREERQVGG
jgi:predicted  nucleic acid-binding Zn-ribbon protein